jgi:hypothetical protein
MHDHGSPESSEYRSNAAGGVYVSNKNVVNGGALAIGIEFLLCGVEGLK